MSIFDKARLRRLIEESDRKICIATALLEQVREALYEAENTNRIAKVLVENTQEKS